MKITTLALAVTAALLASPAFAQSSVNMTTTASTAAPAKDSGFSLSAGVDYTSGDYGTNTTTEILSVPFTAKYNTGNWTFKASVPWMRVSGDPSVVPGVGAGASLTGRGKHIGVTVTNPNGTGTTSSSASGIGDVRVAATYSFNTGTPLGVDLTGNVKFGTADDTKGLGTGATDYGVAVDLYRDFSGTTLFGGVGYTRLGKSVYVTRQNVGGANVGFSHKLGFGSIGASYEYRQSAVSKSGTTTGVYGSGYGDPRSEITGFYNFPAGDKGKFQLYALAGLAKGSPDWGGGLSYTQSF